MRKSLLITFLISLTGGSCNNDGDGASSPVQSAETEEIPTEDLGGNTLVTYQDIQPIMEEYCISCHNEAAAEANGKPDSDFTTFTGARPYGSLMPTFELFADLDADDQQTINDWIDNGLTEADYNAGVKAVLDANCISCHPADAPNRKGLPKTNLKTESTVKLYGSLLPSFGELKGVSNDQQLILEAWVRDGLQ